MYESDAVVEFYNAGLLLPLMHVSKQAINRTRSFTECTQSFAE